MRAVSKPCVGPMLPRPVGGPRAGYWRYRRLSEGGAAAGSALRLIGLIAHESKPAGARWRAFASPVLTPAQI